MTRIFRLASLASALALALPAPLFAQQMVDNYRAAEQAYREAATKAPADRKACFLEWADYYQCLQRSLGPGSASCTRPASDPGCPGDGAPGHEGDDLTGADEPSSVAALPRIGAGGGITGSAAALIASQDSGMKMAGTALIVGSIGLWWLSNQPSFLQPNDQWAPCVDRWGEENCTTYLEENKPMFYGAVGALTLGAVLLVKGYSGSVTVNVSPKGASVSKRIRF